MCVFFSDEIVQGWKIGKHPMGRVRSYEPTPVTPPANVQLTDFTFKLIQVELGDASKSNFNEKYKVKIPVHIRSRYSDDVVFGSEWRELLNDFDKKCLSFHLVLVSLFGLPYLTIQEPRSPRRIVTFYAESAPPTGPRLRFSTKFSGPLTPVPTPKETVPEKPAWVGEPGTVQELINKFNIEVKLSGRTPGTTLYVVGSRDRSGIHEPCHYSL